jgi:5'-nucleotidase
VRTFQRFLWKDMPGALLPDDPNTPAPADWYSPQELKIFRLSSKSHWDVPIRIGRKTVHFLVSHPTPPVFDGPEDRNGTRNHDEIRFWADYIDPARSRYIYDDRRKLGGLDDDDLFVIAGDENADPLDGDSVAGAIQQLLNHPLVNTSITPSSQGAVEQAALQGGANATHQGDPAFDTADFADTAPGNLRADYVLPHKDLTMRAAQVFWPLSSDPLFALVGVFPFPSSDHRLTWVDVSFAVKPALTLTLLETNDGETKLINSPTNADFGGVARLKTLVDKLRAEAMQGPGERAVILLSGADNYIPGPQFNASLAKGVPFYDTIAMKLIGYDASAIGNHEFDLGPDVFADFIQGFEGTLPFVSANLDFSGEPRLQAFVDDKILVKSYVIKKHDARIGVVGVTTPLLPVITSARNVVVDPDYVARVQEEIDRLQARHINKIIVFGQLQGIQADIELASQLRGVDIIVSAGGQELLANPGDLLVPGDPTAPFGPFPMYATSADGAQVPIITTNGDYKYVGRLVVDFDKEGRIISVDPSSGPVRVAGDDCGGTLPCNDAVAPDPQVQALVVDPVAAYVAGLANNIIATSEVALEGRRDPGVRTQETNLGNLMADSLLWQANQLAPDFGVAPAQVAMQNGGGIRNNSLIPAGNISELTTFSIAPFLNFVAMVPDIPPAQFKEIMENAVSRVEFVDGRFAQIAGFSMVYDPAGTPQLIDVTTGAITQAGSRVVEIRLDDGTYIVQNGAVVAGAPSVNVATIDFLANGGDQYPFRPAPFTRLGATYQQALSNYIVSALGGVITAADYPEGGEGRITTGTVTP